MVPGLVHPGRNGYLWMLERSATGISFIDAKPYVKQNVFTSIDPVTGRPEYDMERKPGINKPAIYCPSLWGGKDWPPAAYNPGTGYLYIPANENLCQHLVGEDVEYRPGQQFTGAQTVDFLVDENADHIGELQAWNLRTGERAWTQEFESPNWGPVMTTAGGLVFSGGTNDRYFRAFDAATGRHPLAAPHELRHHGRADVVRDRRRAVHRRAVGLGRRRARHDGAHRPRARHGDDRAAGRRRLGVRAEALTGARRARMKFRDHAVLITGASSGIGAALARELAREGAKLVLMARRQRAARGAARRARRCGRRGASCTSAT